MYTVQACASKRERGFDDKLKKGGKGRGNWRIERERERKTNERLFHARSSAKRCRDATIEWTPALIIRQGEREKEDEAEGEAAARYPTDSVWVIVSAGGRQKHRLTSPLARECAC